jgi:DNA-binding IclR family transcriptional regulator
VAAMSITAPTSRISQKRVPQLAQDLIEMTNVASEALGWISESEAAAAD